MKKSIYFACALMHGQLTPYLSDLYEFIGETLRNAGHSVYMPHEEPLPEVSPKGIYEHCTATLAAQDVVVSYLGKASWGAGLETAIAGTLGKFLIGIVEVSEVCHVESAVLGSLDVLIVFKEKGELAQFLLAALSDGIEKGQWILMTNENEIQWPPLVTHELYTP